MSSRNIIKLQSCKVAKLQSEGEPTLSEVSAHGTHPSPFILHPLFSLALCALVSLATSGCAAYRFGNKSLYTCDVNTVHVPVFRSDSFRRNLGERLTEAVVKEIELKTPFTIVSSERADSVLSGVIVSETKGVHVLNADSEPRALETNLQVQVTWTNRRGESVIGRTITMPLPDDTFVTSTSAAFVPEGGQSISTAQQAAIQRLATQIVEQMQSGW